MWQSLPNNYPKGEGYSGRKQKGFGMKPAVAMRSLRNYHCAWSLFWMKYHLHHKVARRLENTTFEKHSMLSIIIIVFILQCHVYECRVDQ